MIVGNISFFAENSSRIILKEDGSTERLMNKSMKLLVLLSSKIGSVFTREYILKSIWGSDDDDALCYGRSMDVFITHLRNALKETNVSIVNVKGVGYKLQINQINN